jgi:hypothetical protein
MPIAPKIITVKIKPDGTPDCSPDVTRVRPGGTIKWAGKAHTGFFTGNAPGPLPFAPHGWAVVSEHPDFHNPDTVQVHPQAATGVSHKYSVTVGGKTLDPIVIIDDNAD